MATGMNRICFPCTLLLVWEMVSLVNWLWLDSHVTLRACLRVHLRHENDPELVRVMARAKTYNSHAHDTGKYIIDATLTLQMTTINVLRLVRLNAISTTSIKVLTVLTWSAQWKYVNLLNWQKNANTPGSDECRTHPLHPVWLNADMHILMKCTFENPWRSSNNPQQMRQYNITPHTILRW